MTCNLLLRSRPAELNLLRRLAFVLAAGGKAAEALRHAARACELAPQDPRAWSDHGCIRAMLGEWREAAGHFLRALDLDRDFAVGWHNLGVTLSRLGDPRAALTALRNASLLDTRRPDTCLALGNLLVQQGLVEAALANFERAEQIARETAGGA